MTSLDDSELSVRIKIECLRIIWNYFIIEQLPANITIKQETVETPKKKPGRPPKSQTPLSPQNNMETEDEEDQEMMEAEVIFSNMPTSMLSICFITQQII